MLTREQLTPIIAEALASHDTGAFLVELKVSAQPKILVLADTDTGIKLHDCIRLSHHVREALTAHSINTDALELEVSSPGLGRPLVLPRQYPRHVGRLLKVKYAETLEVEGTLTEATPDYITLEFSQENPDPKAKPRVQTTRVSIPFALIQEARVEVQF